MSERATVVQVFAKCPGHGRPKTRLQPPLSQAEASCLHWQLTTLTVQLAARFTTHVELWLDRESTHPWVLDLIEQSACRVRCQPEGNLGVRMAFAMQSALTDQARVLLVGSDCPVLDLPLLEQAAMPTNIEMRMDTTFLISNHNNTFITYWHDDKITCFSKFFFSAC